MLSLLSFPFSSKLSFLFLSKRTFTKLIQTNLNNLNKKKNKQENNNNNNNNINNINIEKYSEVQYGRRNKERNDSLTIEILQDRLKYKERLNKMFKPKELIKNIKELGHGKKTRLNSIYTSIEPTQETWMSKTAARTNTGAGGLATLVGSSTKNWPIFKHMLPEIAFAGHSNSGKSTLINAMIGKSPRGGLAGVSSRAGWTDQINFYQLGKKPPLLTLVDLPGYGHAVASPRLLKAWGEMNRDYMKSRLILSRVYVLVDSMRGICSVDRDIFSFLEKNQIDWKVILTKCDHLSVEDIAKSSLAVYNDILKIKNINSEKKKQNNDNNNNNDNYKNKEKIVQNKKMNKKVVVNEELDDENDENFHDSEVDESYEMSAKKFMGFNFDNSNFVKSKESSATKVIKEEKSIPKLSLTKNENLQSTQKSQTKRAKEFLQDQMKEEEEEEQEKDSKHKIHDVIFDDEDELLEQLSNEKSSFENSVDSKIVITNEGEIIGGYDIDYNSLSSDSPLYKLLMKHSKNRLKEYKKLRDQEIAENKTVEDEIIYISSDEESENENEDDIENDSFDIDDSNDSKEDKVKLSNDEYIDSNLSELKKYVLPVSATTGAGIKEMWEDIRQCVNKTVKHPADWENRYRVSDERKEELARFVREHKLADEERKKFSNSR